MDTGAGRNTSIDPRGHSGWSNLFSEQINEWRQSGCVPPRSETANISATNNKHYNNTNRDEMLVCFSMATPLAWLKMEQMATPANAWCLQRFASGSLDSADSPWWECISLHSNSQKNHCSGGVNSVERGRKHTCGWSVCGLLIHTDSASRAKVSL